MADEAGCGGAEGNAAERTLRLRAFAPPQAHLCKQNTKSGLLSIF
jgi:hypothetical protein